MRKKSIGCEGRNNKLHVHIKHWEKYTESKRAQKNISPGYYVVIGRIWNQGRKVYFY